jgi:hypothetical protein
MPGPVAARQPIIKSRREAMPSGEQKVFRSFGDFRRHFFPKQAKREQERAGVENILDEAKFDRPGYYKRPLTKEDEELMQEMGLAGE